MPQLDTVYILLTFTWTWFTIHLITQKVKTLQITSGPKKQHYTKPLKPLPALPWT